MGVLPQSLVDLLLVKTNKHLKSIAGLLYNSYMLGLRDLCNLETLGPKAVAPECSKGTT